MQTLRTETRDNILILTLDRGRSNPINAQMVAELRAVTREVTDSQTLRGVVLTGKQDFFSTGLDVIELYGYDRETMHAFWPDLGEMVLEITACPKPWIAAVTGHAPAGGCVLSLCCDYRIMAEGKYRIGLNEIPVGVVIPPVIYHLYAFAIGQERAYRHIMDGTLFTPGEALEIGLLHEVSPPEAVLERALAKMQQYLALSPAVWTGSKRLLRQSLLQQLRDEVGRGYAATNDHWWTPESRLTLQAMIERLKKA